MNWQEVVQFAQGRLKPIRWMVVLSLKISSVKVIQDPIPEAKAHTAVTLHRGSVGTWKDTVENQCANSKHKPQRAGVWRSGPRPWEMRIFMVQSVRVPKPRGAWLRVVPSDTHWELSALLTAKNPGRSGVWEAPCWRRYGRAMFLKVGSVGDFHRITWGAASSECVPHSRDVLLEVEPACTRVSSAASRAC